MTPLACAYRRLPAGAVRARGWLAAELARLAAGLTGTLGQVWDDVGRHSAWRGGDGESWERGPYYVRGLVLTSQTLGDSELARTAAPWIEWTLASQRDDGRFGPMANDDWWARMPMLDALRWHAEATGDARVVPFVERYLRYAHATLPARPLDLWARARGGDQMAHALWLHERRAAPWVLELVDLLRAQAVDWCAELTAEVPSSDFELAHGVNRAMGLRLPAMVARCTGDRALLDVVRTGWDRTLAHHGQIQGGFSCDELLHGTGPTQGTELCTVVELLHTMLDVLEVGGAPWCGDAIERLAYNALPAMIGPDGCTRQYFALANQVACTPGPHHFWYHHDSDLLFGVATGYGCCTANMHLGWPTVVRSLWIAGADGTLAAPVFGPCEVRMARPDGARLHLVEDTAYPFEDRVRMAIGLDRPSTFRLAPRIPGWARAATVTIDGAVAWQGDGGDFVALDRTWHDGAVVEIHLPSPLRTSRWDGGVGVERGPLVYAHAIGEDWRRVAGTAPFADFALHPTTAWNHAIAVDASGVPAGARVQVGSVGSAPWTSAGAPIQVHAHGRVLPGWGLDRGSAARPPSPGVDTVGPQVPMTLVPFGAARLRIAVLPEAMRDRR